MNNIVIHYNEIATKGQNRKNFELLLVKNIKTAIKNKKVRKIHGKIIVDLTEKYDEKTLSQTLQKIPGIANFSFAKQSTLDLEDIQKTALEITKSKKFKTFAIATQRTNKKYPLTSQQVNEKVGSTIYTKLNKKVDLSSPDLKIHIEISEKESFIYAEKIQGIGGLPLGSTGHLICSLSGGIDSPVAAQQMMKRGTKITFAHFHNKTINSEAALQKINDLVKTLTPFQNSSALYIIPFEEIQKEIIKHIPSDSRMIVYRRFMNKILSQLAQKIDASAIVTGDNLGQVASQTPENLHSIYQAATIPIIHPLIAYNKNDIVDLAKQIDTFEISTRPYEDCCSFMIAQNPKTKSRPQIIQSLEDKIPNQDKLIENAITNSEIKRF